MSESPILRRLVCPTCGRTWEVPYRTSECCPGCGVQGTPVCRCGCGADLSGLRADASTWSDACRTRLSRERTRDVAVTRDRSGTRGGNVRDLDTARTLQATSDEKARWTAIIDEQIRRVLLDQGTIHANDLDPLGVPADHCNLIGARIAWHGNKGFTVATTERRKVGHRAANGRKTFVHRLTERGRDWLAGLDTGNPEGTAVTDPPTGAAPSTGRTAHMGAAQVTGAGSSPSVEPGEDSAEVSAGDASAEPARLFDPPSTSPYDREAA